MVLSCSHAMKNTLRSKYDTDSAPTDKTELVTFGMKQSVSFQILKFGNKFQQYIPFCGSLTVCWSASVQVAREPNISSTLLVIAQNEHQKMSCFNRGNTSVHRFSSSSPPMWIYSPVWFVCQTKMALWLARLPVNQASVKRVNWACYNG